MPTPPNTPLSPSVNGETPSLKLQHSELPAFVASLILHVALMLGLALLWNRPSAGTGSTSDREVGIAIAYKQKDETKYVDATEIAAEATEKTTAAGPSTNASSSAPLADLAPPLDLAGILESMKSAPAPTASTGLAGDVALSGSATSGNLGSDTTTNPNETTTMVFGVSGSGSRFLYVFDRSDSMNGAGGRPLAAAKRELIRSIQTLGERQQFQVIFYNDQPTPFQPAGQALQMLRGEPNNIRRAVNYIESIRAFGGTEHDSALKMALRMGPDVIFFLTDARIPRLSAGELFEIQQRAIASGTTIHAIEFGSEPSAPDSSFLRELAAMNGGSYQYVNTRALKVTP